jgi:NAD(P)-dependent dehydrogenase (short-subunit alcohol dehydrogenase family)
VTTLVIGGTNGIGRHLVERYVARGEDVLIAGRDRARAEAVAAEIGGDTRGLGVDLSEPQTIAPALDRIEALDRLVISAIEQGVTRIDDLDLDLAARVITIKLVGYAEAVRALAPRITAAGAVVLFGGLAKDRPYPGSTMVTTMNAGVDGLTRTLAWELAPLRINAIHPGVVGDSPKWRDVPDHPAIPRTPIGRLVTMEEVAGAVDFLLQNSGVNGISLNVDGGWLLT